MAFLCVIIFFPLILNAQKINGPIVLTNRQLSDKPKEFYIAGVDDDRIDNNAVAYLLPTLAPFVKYKVDLQNGAADALKRFADYAIPPNKKLRPVNIRIKKFRIVEEAKSNAEVQGKLELQLLFELNKDFGAVRLVEYPTTVTYTGTPRSSMILAL